MMKPDDISAGLDTEDKENVLRLEEFIEEGLKKGKGLFQTPMFPKSSLGALWDQRIWAEALRRCTDVGYNVRPLPVGFDEKYPTLPGFSIEHPKTVLPT
jgi:hypothetical protein